MSALIKQSSEDGRVRDLVRGDAFARSHPVPDPAALELARLKLTCETLQAELVERDAEIDRLLRNIDQAYEDGEASGRCLGLAERDSSSAERTELLSGAIERAVEAFRIQLAELDRLAPLLAKRGLAKVLGDPSSHAELLGPIIQNQLRQLELAAVLRVEVSEADFPDEDALVGLGDAVAFSQIELVSSPELSGGACRLRLRLGTVDIGLDRQWPGLCNVLDALARDEGRS